MNNKRVALVAAITALILLAIVATEPRSLFAGGQQKAAKNQSIHIKKINKKWKVIRADGTRKPPTVSQGDTVMWKAFATDVYLNFPDSTLFGTDNASATAGNTLTLTVKPTAKPGRYPYSVFCLKDKEFGTSDSPPIIIIE